MQRIVHVRELPPQGEAGARFPRGGVSPRLIAFLSVLLLCFLLSPSHSAGSSEGATVEITIAATTDVLGQIFPYDFAGDRETNHSLAHAAAYIKKQRAETQNFLLLDGGDILRGSPIVAYYNTVKTPDRYTHVAAQVMNHLGYDAGVPGDRDIEAGPEVYRPTARQFRFPWLACNILDADTGAPYFQPYQVFDKQGVKIAVLGMGTPGMPRWVPEEAQQGLVFADMVQSAEKWVSHIQKKEHPAVLVGLFHSGTDYTHGGADANTRDNPDAAQLVAEKVPGFNVIFTGHDHRRRNTRVNDVLILGGGKQAEALAVAHITARRSGTQNAWEIETRGEPVPTFLFRPDPEFMARFSRPYRETKEYLSQPVGTLSRTIETRDALFGDSAYTDLIHRFQLHASGGLPGGPADVSFAAPQYHNRSIEAGPIRIRDLFSLFRFENYLYLVRLSGKEIRDYLEYSYKGWAGRMRDEQDHLLLFKPDSETSEHPIPATRYYHYSSAAGIVYTVDVSRPPGKRVNILGMDRNLDGHVDAGEPFHFRHDYLAAVNSYRGEGGGGHLTYGIRLSPAALRERRLAVSRKNLRRLMEEYLRERKQVTTAPIGHWKFIPESWAAKGAARDAALLRTPEASAPR